MAYTVCFHGSNRQEISTTHDAGFCVSTGHPVDAIIDAGFDVSTGHPVGTMHKMVLNFNYAIN